jgi:hypothetical protein
MILSLLYVHHSFPLVLKNFGPNFAQVIGKYVLFNDLANRGIAFQNCSPILFPHEVAFNGGDGCVYKGSSLVKRDSISANNNFIIVLYAVPLLLVYLVPNDHFSFVNEHYFIEFIKFCFQYFPSF